MRSGFLLTVKALICAIFLGLCVGACAHGSKGDQEENANAETSKKDKKKKGAKKDKKKKGATGKKSKAKDKEAPAEGGDSGGAEEF